jgi:hypothetical protein
MMGNFTFLTPLYLVGLLSAAIPLIIHLSRSRRTKKMRFSTTRFFTDQFLRSYRMSRLKELLLLATRMALFALLAMALARPLLAPKGPAAAANGGPRAVVLVLDDSASMGYVEDGKPLFGRAQEAARNILATLGPSDSASLVLAGRRAGGAEVVFPEPTDQIDDVRRAVDQAKVTGLGTDLTGAIDRAEELAGASRTAGKSVAIYVLSDLQESGWSDSASETSRAANTDVSYSFVAIRPRKPVNRAVTAVRYAATRPRVGVPFPIRPWLALTGDDGKDVNVRLYIDGHKVGEQKIELLPGGLWASPRFYHTFTSSGWHAGHVEVDDEALPADNRRYFALEVPETSQSVEVLAVNGAPSNVPSQDGLFFLRFALGVAPEGQKGPFQLTAVAPAAVAGTELGKYPLVILANVERLTEGAVEKLEDYVAGGGSLLVFLGDKVDVRFYNDKLAAANRRHGGLLPARLKPRDPMKKGSRLEEEVGFISALNYEHRALAAFQEPKLGTLLGPSLTFKAVRAEAPESAVLMKTSKGAPLLCEKPFGRGKVMLFTSTCNRDWTAFPREPAFPLWSRFVAEYLTQDPLNQQAGYRTGDVVSLPGDDKGRWVQKPDGKRVAATRGDDSGAFTFSDTHEPGVYTVLKADQETRVGLFAVNLESYESDLTYLGTGDNDVVKDLQVRLGQPPLVTYVDDPGKLSDALGGSGRAFKLWDVILVVVLLIGLFEPWLANQISIRLYGKPREAPAVVGPGEARGARVPALGLAEVQGAGGAAR